MTLNKLVHILVFFLPLFASAQYKDAGMWTDLSCSFEPTKKWQLSASPEIRLNENLSRLSRAFVDFGAQYKYKKHFYLSATLRVGAAHIQDYFEARQRLQLGIAYKDKIGDFSFAVQSRWQAAVRPAASENDADFTTTMRNKAQLKYTGLKGVDLGTSIELFNNTQQYQQFQLQTWRWVINVDKKINKQNSIALGYLIQKNIVESPQEMDFVLLLSYQITFEQKKENEKKVDEVR